MIVEGVHSQICSQTLLLAHCPGIAPDRDNRTTGSTWIEHRLAELKANSFAAVLTLWPHHINISIATVDVLHNISCLPVYKDYETLRMNLT